MNRSTILMPILCSCLVATTASADGGTTCASGPTPIPDGSAGVARTLDVNAPANAVVTSVGVTVQATHPWVGDLRGFVLRHPSGVEIVLLDQPGLPSIGFPGPWGCGGDNVFATFVDSAPTAGESMCSTTAVPVIAGDVQPLQSLASLHGLSASGRWTLIATDLAAVDAGVLADVCLTLGTALRCLADGNADGVVDGADLASLLGAWGPCAGCNEDLTGDGTIDGGDLAILLGAWGPCR